MDKNKTGNNQESKDSDISRRDFLKNLLRITAGGLLAAGAGTLIYKSGRAKALHSCKNEFICPGCKVLNDCILPQGLSYKKVKKGKGAGGSNG